MKANELRIGNLVYNPNLKEFRCLDILDIRDFAEKRLYLDFEPILLTEEWLARFGFKNGGYDFLFWYLNDFELAGNDFLNQDEEIPEYAYNWYLDNNKHKQILIQYVHQLQNLYFALTNEELTIITQ